MGVVFDAVCMDVVDFPVLCSSLRSPVADGAVLVVADGFLLFVVVLVVVLVVVEDEGVVDIVDVRGEVVVVVVVVVVEDVVVLVGVVADAEAFPDKDMMPFSR